MRCGLAPAHLLLGANHTVCRGVRLRSRLQQAVSSQLQVLFPRPRSAAYHLEVSPLAWGDQGRPPVGASWESSSCQDACEVQRLVSCVFLPLHCIFRWPLCTQVLSVRGRTREKPEPKLPLGCSPAFVQPARPPTPPPRPGGGKGNGDQASPAGPCWD